jgi:hypothetical protein
VVENNNKLKELQMGLEKMFNEITVNENELLETVIQVLEKGGVTDDGVKIPLAIKMLRDFIDGRKPMED